MLEPDRRHLFVDALRPPPNMRLDTAVGTTFSLDLEALLIAPIAFALFEVRTAETGDTTAVDPLAVMEAVRRHASRIDLFCQAGQISIPPRDRPVLALLEDSVHPAAAPSHHHIFHPKVWCLRFLDPETQQAAYRLLVLSRNLTFDSSWDTIVSLDGVPSETNGDLRDQNQPLVDFLHALPGLSTRTVTEERTERIRNLAGELIDVEWVLPEGFSGLRFLPSGIDGHRSELPAPRDKLLVISPFLTSQQLSAIASTEDRADLISRPESLDRIEKDLLDRFRHVYVLADGSDYRPDQRDEAGPETESAFATTTEETGEKVGADPSGIHAKVLVSDQGGSAEIRSGSTNATTAGWGGNVEFDVALQGRKRQCGVDAVLGGEGKESGLLNLLRLYERTEPDPLPEDEAERLAFELEKLGREIARLALTARVEPDGDGFRLSLASEDPLPSSSGVEISCWPATLRPETARPQTPGEPVAFAVEGLSLPTITSFFVFELGASGEAGRVTTRIVSNARLIGAPEDRAERILLEQLKSKGDVLRYLLLLLADVGEGIPHELATLLAGDSTAGDWQAGQIPLLEAMVRALSRQPDALDPVEQLISDLRRTEEGAELLPEGLDLLWPAIWEARRQLT